MGLSLVFGEGRWGAALFECVPLQARRHKRRGMVGGAVPLWEDGSGVGRILRVGRRRSDAEGSAGLEGYGAVS